MKKALPVLQVKPELAPMMKEMLLFLVRGFRAGRGLEDVIERSMTQIEQAAGQPKQAPVDPRLAKVETDAKIAAAELQQEGELERRRQDQHAALVTREQNLEALGAHQDRHIAALDTRGADGAGAGSRWANAVTVYVMRGGKLVDKRRAAPLHAAHGRAAYVISDVMAPVKHMGTGKVIDSKSRFPRPHQGLRLCRGRHRSGRFPAVPAAAAAGSGAVRAARDRAARVPLTFPTKPRSVNDDVAKPVGGVSSCLACARRR
jgi:hypothetical protein